MQVYPHPPDPMGNCWLTQGSNSGEYLRLKFDPLRDRPHIVRANQEELAIVDLIAEREGIQPQKQKKWAHIPKIVFFDSPCRLVQSSWSFIGGIEEAPHTICDRST